MVTNKKKIIKMIIEFSFSENEKPSKEYLKFLDSLPINELNDLYDNMTESKII